MYNTETARLIGEFSSGYVSDSGFISEELYKKSTGEFFLVGEGGACSKYAVREGPNTWSSGIKIIPLTLDESRKWCEENLSADEYIALFGEPKE